LPLAASATTLVIPASGTGPGANDSHWQTELTLHILSASPITATLTFHDLLGAAGTSSIAVAPRATVAIADVVATRFGRAAATSGRAIAYGSAVNNISGDPTYVPGILARADSRINFAGVAFGDSASVSVPDANHDGVLDRSIDVQTGSWPISFRIIVNSAAPA